MTTLDAELIFPCKKSKTGGAGRLKWKESQTARAGKAPTSRVPMYDLRRVPIIFTTWWGILIRICMNDTRVQQQQQQQPCEWRVYAACVCFVFVGCYRNPGGYGTARRCQCECGRYAQRHDRVAESYTSRSAMLKVGDREILAAVLPEGLSAVARPGHNWVNDISLSNASHVHTGVLYPSTTFYRYSTSVPHLSIDCYIHTCTRYRRGGRKIGYELLYTCRRDILS